MDRTAADHGHLNTLKEHLVTVAHWEDADIEVVLGGVWDGLVLARWCGLEAAGADPTFKSRQRNAESVEYDLAGQLAGAPALRGRCGELMMPATTGAAHIVTVDEDTAQRAVTAIGDLARIAAAQLRSAATKAAEWPDQRACLNSIVYWRSLVGCWAGEHVGYELVLPPRPPSWWPVS